MPNAVVNIKHCCYLIINSIPAQNRNEHSKSSKWEWYSRYQNPLIWMMILLTASITKSARNNSQMYELIPNHVGQLMPLHNEFSSCTHQKLYCVPCRILKQSYGIPNISHNSKISLFICFSKWFCSDLLNPEFTALLLLNGMACAYLCISCFNLSFKKTE